MLEATTYFISLALFGFVIFGTVQVRDEMLLLICIPPMFVALVVGFIMLIYMGETFGVPVAIGSLVVPLPLAWLLGRRYTVRDLLIVIYLAWALGMVFALVAFNFPDAGS
jgi:hypothetical protein